MGAWGPGLYQDDVTCDIKEEYVNWLKIGKTNEEAMAEMIVRNEDCIEDVEEGPLFWFALADTQWKYGRLHPDVKEIAIEYIKSGVDLERWKENKKMYPKRKKVLSDLEKKLSSPQPPEKKVSKLVLDKAAWEVGDVLLYQIHNEDEMDKKWNNKYVLFRVIGRSETNIGSLPMKEYHHEQSIVSLYNWVGEKEPDLERIKDLPFALDENVFRKIVPSQFTFSFNKRELKKLNFKVILKDDKYKDPSEHLMTGIGASWLNTHNLDSVLVCTLSEAYNQDDLIDETDKNGQE